jgi:hypothetical protein
MTSSASGVVLVSFGSVHAAHEMPDTWKRAILSLANTFPTYQFIWKYEIAADYENGTLADMRIPTNMHLSAWIPQTDILGKVQCVFKLSIKNEYTGHSSLKAFVTHGGYNSLLESAYAGESTRSPQPNCAQANQLLPCLCGSTSIVMDASPSVTGSASASTK